MLIWLNRVPRWRQMASKSQGLEPQEAYKSQCAIPQENRTLDPPMRLKQAEQRQWTICSLSESLNQHSVPQQHRSANARGPDTIERHTLPRTKLKMMCKLSRLLEDFSCQRWPPRKDSWTNPAQQFRCITFQSLFTIWMLKCGSDCHILAVWQVDACNQTCMLAECLSYLL